MSWARPVCVAEKKKKKNTGCKWSTLSYILIYGLSAEGTFKFCVHGAPLSRCSNTTHHVWWKARAFALVQGETKQLKIDKTVITGGTRWKVKSWKVKIHTQSASTSHHYCFLKDIWILKSAWKVPPMRYRLVINPVHCMKINNQSSTLHKNNKGVRAELV